MKQNRARRYLYSDVRRRTEETLTLIGRENGQSKSILLRKDFKAVNEFFLSTEIRLKSFNESSFQRGEMKRRVTSEKYRESIVIVLKGAQLIIEEVLPITESRETE